MTSLPEPRPGQKKLGLVIDLDFCVGCHACATACKEWNTGGSWGPLPDFNPYGAREFDEDAGVMKKCTLCIDRIYNENLAEEDRLPACVMVCPVSARHFGDLGDPDSDVSRMVADRHGADLLPELGYRPVNKYLPPRPQRQAPCPPVEDRAAPAADLSISERLALWADRVLSR